MRRYGYIQAGGGQVYSGRLDQLSPGDRVFVYAKGEGYLGYATVTSSKVLASEFRTDAGPLFEQPLDAPAIKTRSSDPADAEYLVAVDWHRTFDRTEAKTFPGVFANQNVVCKLRHQATVDFVMQEFGVEDAPA